jgi:hypothetical protein
MKWWIDAAQYGTEALSIALMLRLLLLRERRESVYLVFVAFLSGQLLGTSAYFLFDQWHYEEKDYRIFWICMTGIMAAVSLWMVYSLAMAVLAGLPAISKVSRAILNGVFAISILVAGLTLRGEYWVSHGVVRQDSVDRIVAIVHIADRAIASASVLILLAILAFILWFPVKMSRNLAIFSVGFVIYFACKTGLELLVSYSAPAQTPKNVLSICNSFILVLCFIYWIVFIDPKRQVEEVRMGHSWHPQEQAKLIDQLEALNLALQRNVQRLEL